MDTNETLNTLREQWGSSGICALVTDLAAALAVAGNRTWQADEGRFQRMAHHTSKVMELAHGLVNVQSIQIGRKRDGEDPTMRKVGDLGPAAQLAAQHTATFVAMSSAFFASLRMHLAPLLLLAGPQAVSEMLSATIMSNLVECLRDDLQWVRKAREDSEVRVPRHLTEWAGLDKQVGAQLFDDFAAETITNILTDLLCVRLPAGVAVTEAAHTEVSRLLTWTLKQAADAGSPRGPINHKDRPFVTRLAAMRLERAREALATEDGA